MYVPYLYMHLRKPTLSIYSYLGNGGKYILLLLEILSTVPKLPYNP